MEFKVSVDLSELTDGVQSAVTAQVLPTVHQAVKAIAAETAYRWKNDVSKARLWNGEKQPYIDSIRWMMTGDFSAVVSTDYHLAQQIEGGRPAFDQKRYLNTSLKVRSSKKGRYLIIPFRHNVTGQSAHARPMPEDIYRQAKMLDASRVTGQFQRPSGTGAFSLRTRRPITVPAKRYALGDRLPAGLAQKLKDHHSHDPYAGLVRFKTSAGGANSSAYMTFRIMGEWQTNKWIVPAKPGLYLAQKVASSMATEAPQVFAQAIKFLK